MINRTQIGLYFLGITSLVRGLDLLLLVIAQYLVSIYIFSSNTNYWEVLIDTNLFFLVVATVFAVAAGSIINNLYDQNKDRINRPIRTFIESSISKKTKFYSYLLFNLVSLFVALSVSRWAFLYFLFYILGLWLYSSILKKYFVIGSVMAALLTISPLFSIFLYYKNFEWVLVFYSAFLFLLILTREFLKDIKNILGDFTMNYKTIPVVYGERTTKITITITTFLLIIVASILIHFFNIGMMYLYFLFSIVTIVIFAFFIWKTKTKKHFVYLDFTLKIVIIVGVLSIVLIDLTTLKTDLWKKIMIQ